MITGGGDPHAGGVVLVVDDFDDGRALVAEILAFEGFEVEQAENGERALELAAERLPGVVVTDLSLPDIDGFEICRRLKNDARTSGIRVIVLTAHAGDSYEGEARAAGCDLFMVKPTPPKTLSAAIRRMLEAGRASAKGGA